MVRDLVTDVMMGQFTTKICSGPRAPFVHYKLFGCFVPIMIVRV